MDQATTDSKKKDFVNEYLDLCFRHGCYFIWQPNWIGISEFSSYDHGQIILNQISREYQ